MIFDELNPGKQHTAPAVNSCDCTRAMPILCTSYVDVCVDVYVVVYQVRRASSLIVAIIRTAANT